MTAMFALVKGASSELEDSIVLNIADHLKKAGVSVNLITLGGFRSTVLAAKQIWRCDLLIVHSPLIFSALHIMISRILRRPVVGLIWDKYPVTLNKVRFDKSLRRRILDLIENSALKMCSHVIVPSSDFLAAKSLKHAIVLPFWTPIRYEARREATSRVGDRPKILFAGQINRTRDLVSAFAHLTSLLGNRFELLVASSDPLPPSLEARENITYLGFLERAALFATMKSCDFGLVSLSPGFDGPGFPSKTFAYLSAGLPCIYYGKPLPHYTSALQDSGVGFDIGPSCQPLSDWSPPNEHMSEAVRRFSQQFELNSEQLITQLYAIAGVDRAGASV